MKINKFKKVGLNKYKIYSDNGVLTIYEDVILKYNLLYKKEIDDTLLEKINMDNYKASIYDSALKYIGVRMRSEKEVKEYLLKKGFSLKDIDNTIVKLLSNGLLNDTNFAKSYINDKLYLTNNGPDKIKCELIKLGVEESIIDTLLKEIDNKLLNDKLCKIIDKEIKLNSKLPIIKLKNKIINRCINLGYKIDSINEILSNINICSNSDIKKDYDKLYSKYKDKYDSYKLKSYLKGKLYQKGYTIDEINKVIDE